jgi:hypothetical protein
MVLTYRKQRQYCFLFYIVCGIGLMLALPVGMHWFDVITKLSQHTPGSGPAVTIQAICFVLFGVCVVASGIAGAATDYVWIGHLSAAQSADYSGTESYHNARARLFARRTVVFVAVMACSYLLTAALLFV